MTETVSHRRCWPSLVGWCVVGGLLAYILVIHSSLRLYEDAIQTQQGQLNKALDLVLPLSIQVDQLKQMANQTAGAMRQTESDWTIMRRYMELEDPQRLKAVEVELEATLALKQLREDVAKLQQRLDAPR